MRARVAVVAAVVLGALLGSACGSLDSYDSQTTRRYKAMVEACGHLQNDHERSQCLQHVPAKP